MGGLLLLVGALVTNGCASPPSKTLTAESELERIASQPAPAQPCPTP
jgi:hypothetical protein